MCENALKELSIRVIMSDSNSIEDVSVTVVLARCSEASWSQEFSIVYGSSLAESTQLRAGSVGYKQGARVLTGVQRGDKVSQGAR